MLPPVKPDRGTRSRSTVPTGSTVVHMYNLGTAHWKSLIDGVCARPAVIRIRIRIRRRAGSIYVQPTGLAIARSSLQLNRPQICGTYMSAGWHEIEELLQRSETFIFDCDGVLYTYSDELLILDHSQLYPRGCAIRGFQLDHS